jgi:hypothetical protein
MNASPLWHAYKTALQSADGKVDKFLPALIASAIGGKATDLQAEYDTAYSERSACSDKTAAAAIATAWTLFSKRAYKAANKLGYRLTWPSIAASEPGPFKLETLTDARLAAAAEAVAKKDRQDKALSEMRLRQHAAAAAAAAALTLADIAAYAAQACEASGVSLRDLATVLLSVEPIHGRDTVISLYGEYVESAVAAGKPVTTKQAGQVRKAA